MAFDRPELVTLAAGGDSFLAEGRHWRPSRFLFGVVGQPVSHSLSPVFQNAALDNQDFVADYIRLQLQRDELPLFHQYAWTLGFRGFNVTIPHKEGVSHLCAELTDQARRAGAVNTVRVEQEQWVGHNTDIAGVRHVLQQWQLKAGFAGVVLGAGGSARAAILALADAGAETVDVVAREGVSRQATVEWLGSGVDLAAAQVKMRPWDVINPPADVEVVVVSCLPAGVTVDGVLGPARGRSFLLDMRYGKQETGTLPSGWIRRDGRDVLLAQGAASFKWWFFQEAPLEVMTLALAAALD